MVKKPIIAVTLDHEDDGKYSAFPYYALRENYFESISRAGGTPIALPYGNGLGDGVAETYLEMVDGLLVPGGNHDIPPEYFGSSAKTHESVNVKSGRLKFEWELMRKAIDRNMPLLGICAGMQILNCVEGGTMIQHIPDEVENALPHEVKDRLKAAHEIEVVEASILNTITGKLKYGVNSSHHQAVNKIASGYLASAKTSDGVVEAIEKRGAKFCLGVQWHPEYGNCEEDKALFVAFVQAASK